MALEGDMAEVLERWFTCRQGELYTAAAGVVVSFDPATCLADVRPAVRATIEADADSDTTDELPILTEVPVIYLQCAAARVRCPLAPGDPVLVVVLTLSHTQWRLTGEVPSDPRDSRLHALASCVAIAGFVPDVTPHPLTVPDGLEVWSAGPIVLTAAGPVRVESTAVRLGVDDDADTLDKFVALSDKVDANFSAVATALSTPVTVPAGGGPVSFSFSHPSTAASRVKAR